VLFCNVLQCLDQLQWTVDFSSLREEKTESLRYLMV